MDAVQKALRIAKAEGGGSTGAAQGSADAPVQTGTPAVDPQAYVGSLYQDIFHRAPDEAGMKGWVNALTSNAMTPDQVRQGFLTSSEGQVNDLYQGLFGRNLDPAAYNWVNALESKSLTPEQVRSQLMASPEYLNLHPELKTAAAGTSGAATVGGSSGAASGAATGTTTAGATGATTGGTSGGANSVNIANQGMPLIYTPPPYKDYGATAAAFRVASGLENLPAPFYTLSPVSGGTPSNYNPATGYSGGTSLTPSSGIAGGGAGSVGAGGGAGSVGAGGASGKTTYQQVLQQLQGPTAKQPVTQPTGPTSPTGPTAQPTGGVSSRIADIAKLYQQYLGRLPEGGAAEKWADAIAKGQMTFDQALNAIKGSAEATVYGTYKDALGRDATKDPLAQQWVNALASGKMTPGEFQAAIKSSPEYTQNQIAQAYQKYLNRTPSAQELAPWAGAVTSGSMGLGDVVNAIKNSQEAQGLGGTKQTTPQAQNPTQSAIAQAYSQYLGRAPEAGAAEAWANAVSSGQMTTDQAIAAIRNSAEAQSYNQSATVQAAQNAAVAPVASNIAAAYQQYLGRSPEPGAAEAWANAVASGQMTAEQALSAIASSPEAQAYQTYSSAGYGFNSGGAVKGYADGGAASYEDLVNSAYQDFLHRAPDEAGFKSWLNALTSGAISPADFENRFKGAGYEDDIVNAYQTSLNRDPTPSEIANWNTALTNKSMTLNDVMGRIQKSPEATSQQYYANVPSPDKFSQRQGGRMYDIDIGRVERIPELGRMAAPVNVQQQFQNNEIARLQNELEAAKSEKSAAPTSGQGGPDGGAGGNANGGRINAVDSALRMIKADRR